MPVCPPPALAADLTAQCTIALQAMVADNPKIALAAAVHVLALDRLCFTGTSPCVKVHGSVGYPKQSAEGIDNSVAGKQFAACTTCWARHRRPIRSATSN